MKPCCRPSVPYGAVAQSNIIIRFQGARYAWRSMSTHVNTLHAIACLTACEVSHSIHCYSVQRFNRIKLILRSKCLALAGSCEEMAGSFEQANCRRLPKIAGGCQCSIPAIRLDQYTGPGTTCTMYSTF